jgi:hypothetical protein
MLLRLLLLLLLCFGQAPKPLGLLLLLLLCCPRDLSLLNSSSSSRRWCWWLDPYGFDPDTEGVGLVGAQLGEALVYLSDAAGDVNQHAARAAMRVSELLSILDAGTVSLLAAVI